MATPLTDGINALTQYANEVTGKQDTTLSDAVGSLVEGYGGGAGVTSGTFTPSANTVDYSIDTGVTGLTHFLLTAHTLPYAESQNARVFGTEYVDLQSGFMVNTHGNGNTVTSPNQASVFQTGHSYYPTVNGTVISRAGSSGYVGFLCAGIQYDWYAW